MARQTTILRNLVGRILGLSANEYHETRDTVLFILIAFGALIASALLTLWPLDGHEVRTLAILCLLVLILFGFVRDKRTCVVGVLFLLALKWFVAALILSRVTAALVGSALALAALGIAKRKPNPFK
jgi:hypothetical protein